MYTRCNPMIIPYGSSLMVVQSKISKILNSLSLSIATLEPTNSNVHYSNYNQPRMKISFVFYSAIPLAISISFGWKQSGNVKVPRSSLQEVFSNAFSSSRTFDYIALLDSVPFDSRMKRRYTNISSSFFFLLK